MMVFDVCFGVREILSKQYSRNALIINYLLGIVCEIIFVESFCRYKKHVYLCIEAN